jgi:hypothetical protein
MSIVKEQLDHKMFNNSGEQQTVRNILGTRKPSKSPHPKKMSDLVTVLSYSLYAVCF